MKKFLPIICLMSICSTMLAINAQALDASSSWQEIFHSNLEVKFPQVQFMNSFVYVDDVCVAENNQLKTIHPVTRCLKFNSHRAECLQWDVSILTAPRCFTRKLPNQKPYQDCYPLDYDIPVGTEGSAGGFIERFTKPFSIPACE